MPYHQKSRSKKCSLKDIFYINRTIGCFRNLNSILNIIGYDMQQKLSHEKNGKTNEAA